MFPAQWWRSNPILSWGFQLNELNRVVTQEESSAPSVGSVLQEVLKGQEDDWVPYGPTSQKQQEET